jgi:hypothetical protein
VVGLPKSEAVLMQLDLTDGSYDFALAYRYLQGEQIYRDFEFFHGPLSVYWHAFLLQIFPPSLVTIQIAVLVSCILIVTLLSCIVHRATSRNKLLTWLFWICAMYMSVYHWPRGGYSWYSILLSTLAIYLLVGGPAILETERVAALRFVFIGFLLGVAVGMKQSLGVAVVAALTVWIVQRELLGPNGSIRRMAYRILSLLAGTGMVLAVILSHLSRNGNLEAFIQVNRKAVNVYAVQAAVSYWDNFVGPASLLSIPNWSLEQGVLVLLPVGLAFAMMLFVLPWFNRLSPNRLISGRLLALGLDPHIMLWAVLYLAAFAAAVHPRADYPHIALWIPFFFTTLAIFAERFFGPGINATFRRSLGRTSIALNSIYYFILLAILVHFVAQYYRGQVVVFREFPAEGVFATADTAETVNRIREAVRTTVHRPTELVIANSTANFLYPFLKIPNPTRFDHFSGKAMSSDDVRRLASKIQAGQVGALLIPSTESSAEADLFPLYRSALEKLDLRLRVGDLLLFVSKDGRPTPPGGQGQGTKPHDHETTPE